MRWAVRSGPPPRGHASSRRPLIRPKTGKRRHGGPQNCGPPVVLARRGRLQSCEILDRMSQENVEACRRAFDALGTRRDTEAGLPYIDPEIELRSAIIGGAEGTIYRGHDGVRMWMAESDVTWAELRLEADEFRDLGEDVLMIGRLHAKGRESGVEIESPIAWLSTRAPGGSFGRGGISTLRRPSGLPACGSSVWTEAVVRHMQCRGCPRRARARS